MKRVLISGLPFLIITLFLTLVFTACEKENEEPMEEPDPSDLCENPPELSIEDLFHSYIGQNSGRIEVSASGGSGDLMYSIDGVNFSSNTLFEDLAPGNYTITVIDENECEGTITREVNEFPEVSFESEVFPIIQTNCLVSGCHLDTPGLPKWDNYNIIKANAGVIRARVTSKVMPPPSSGITLTDQEISTIQNWVDVGAPNN